MRKTLCIILALAALLSLAACGKAGDSPAAPSQTGRLNASAPQAEPAQWQGLGGCYKLDAVSSGDYTQLEGSPAYLLNDFRDRISSADGAVLVSVSTGYISDYAVTADAVWYLRYTGMVNGEFSYDSYVVKLGFDGQELTRFDVSGRAESLAVVSGAVCVYDAMGKTLFVYGEDGAELGGVDLSGAELEDFSGSLRTAGDGGVWLLSDVESGLLLYPVDLTTMTIGSVYKLPEDTLSLSTGTAEKSFILSTDRELCWLSPATGNSENILYFDECGIIGGELRGFAADAAGFLCLSSVGISRLRPAQPNELRAKTRLTLGTVFTHDESSELAARFNAFSSDYCVEVIDYSDNGSLSPQEAQAKLNTELLSGAGPDLIMLFDLESLHGAAAFADLYPLLDADSELRREDFYGLTAFENGSRLLFAPSHLYVSTFGALPDVMGERTGWTWDEYFSMESKLPADGVMTPYLSAEFFLKNSLDLYAPHAIDWANGTCSFDTPEFVRILEAAKRGYDPNCPAENNYFQDEVNAMMADGRMILQGVGFIDVQSFAQCESLCGALSYIGWPTPDGSCGSVFNTRGVSVNAMTDCMEGCWQFEKFVLKSTYAYKPTFEKAMSDATAPVDANSGEARVTLTQSQVERYRRLMESITVASTDSGTLSDIVLSAAAPMFAGDKTPEETAKLIQSKLSIYVAEHS